MSKKANHKGKENAHAQSNMIVGPLINGVRRPISASMLEMTGAYKTTEQTEDVSAIPELKGAGPKIKTKDGSKVHLKELIKSRGRKFHAKAKRRHYSIGRNRRLYQFLPWNVLFWLSHGIFRLSTRRLINVENTSKHVVYQGNNFVLNLEAKDSKPNHKSMENEFNDDVVVSYAAVSMLEDAQAVRSVSFHPSGNLYAIGANTKVLRICKLTSSNTSIGTSTGVMQVVFKRPKYHRGSIYSMAWSPDGTLLATGSNDKTIKLLNFDAQNYTQVNNDIELNIHSGTIRELAFVPNRDGVLISGGAGDGNVNVTDVLSQKVIGSLNGHTGNVLTVYAGENNLVATGGADNTLRLWDLRCERCVDVVMVGESCPASVALSSKYLASGQEDGSILLYDVTAGRTMQNFRLHQLDCRSVRFSPDYNYLLTSSYDATISLMHLNRNLNSSVPKHYVVARHDDKVIQCRWHPTDNMFLSSSADKSAVLWKAIL